MGEQRAAPCSEPRTIKGGLQNGMGGFTAVKVGEERKTTGTGSTHGDSQGFRQALKELKRLLHRGRLGFHHRLKIIAQWRGFTGTDRTDPVRLAQSLTSLLKSDLSLQISGAVLFPATLVGPWRGDTDRGVFQQQDRQRLSEGRQRLKNLTATKAKLTATLETEGHVGTEFSGELLQDTNAVTKTPQSIQSEQSSGSITGSAGQTSTDRNALLKVNVSTEFMKPDCRATDGQP